MFIDGLELSGNCICGHAHSVYTRFAVIESGALINLKKHLYSAGLHGKLCAIYGENTYRATSDRHPAVDQEIILKSEGLHADETSTAEVLSNIEPDVDLILAIGCGTIHDIARYCAFELGIDFVSCPTGASVDGFSSSVCSLMWHGHKTTRTAKAPIIVVVDTDVIANAPVELAKSGAGDMVAKYTALADWEIAHIVTGEYYCPRIARITRQAADDAINSIPSLLRGEREAFASLSFALVISGMTMQMMGNSRPASGAEHHISHLLEMQPDRLPTAFQAMHGEKAGVGTLLVAAEYKRLGECADLSNHVHPYTEIDATDAESFFGKKLFSGIMKENENDCLRAVTPEALTKSWGEVRSVIAGIPDPLALRDRLIELGAKHSLDDIGVPEESGDALLRYSPLVRNRLTLMRITRMLTL